MFVGARSITSTWDQIDEKRVRQLCRQIIFNLPVSVRQLAGRLDLFLLQPLDYKQGYNQASYLHSYVLNKVFE